MPLGKQIRQYREQAGLTLEKLEELSGVDVGTLSALERRDSKKSAFAGKIASAFGLTVEQLLDSSVVHTTKLGGESYQQQSDNRPALVQSPGASYNLSSWPFAVSLNRVLALPEYDRGRVDGYMLALVEAHEASIKKSAHA